VDSRQRWQALQSNLKISRLRLEQGDFAAALAAVDRALAIDPDFLAAQSLRDRIVAAAPGLPLIPPPVRSDAAIAGDLAAHDGSAGSSAEHDAFPAVLPVAQAAFVSEATVAAVPSITEPAGESNPTPAASSSPERRDIPAVESQPVGIVAESIRTGLLPDVPVDLALAPLPAERPLVSPDGYARCEQRAQRRRVDRRLDAARSALAAGRLKDAACALDEVSALDPNLPELQELTARYHQLRRDRTRPRAGRWLAAAAAFGGIVLGASWLQDATGFLWSRQTVGVSSLVTAPEPFAVALSAAESSSPEVEEAVATSGASSERTVAAEPAQRAAAEPAQRAAAEPAAAETAPAERRADARPSEPRTDMPSSEPPAHMVSLGPQVQAPPPVARAVMEPLRSMAEAAPVTAAAAPAPAPAAPAPAPAVPAPAASTVPPPRSADDELQIKQVLQRYRSAYEGLDARSAHAVWPAVNEAALARAFEGLASQRLTFEACEVKLEGEAAAATCHGSARYVPKVGSREPRVEPRTWDFTLRKNGADWKIQSARAGR
jgi:hypothetical protein